MDFTVYFWISQCAPLTNIKSPPPTNRDYIIGRQNFLVNSGTHSGDSGTIPENSGKSGTIPEDILVIPEHSVEKLKSNNFICKISWIAQCIMAVLHSRKKNNYYSDFPLGYNWQMSKNYMLFPEFPEFLNLNSGTNSGNSGANSWNSGNSGIKNIIPEIPEKVFRNSGNRSGIPEDFLKNNSGNSGNSGEWWPMF